jgi:hypothetical protein
MANLPKMKLKEQKLSEAKQSKTKEFNIEKVEDSQNESYQIVKKEQNIVLFEVQIKKAQPKKYTCNFVAHLDRAKTISQLLDLLQLYKDFLNREIKINGVPLFGEILTGEYTASENADNVDELIKYWKRVLLLEEVLNVKFVPDLPVDINHAEKIEMLCKSFVDKVPFKTGDMTDCELVTSDIESIEKNIGCQGTFAFVLEAKLDGFWGVRKKQLYCVIYSYSVKIKSIKSKEKRKDGSFKVKLNLDLVGDESFTAMKYFKTKEDAEKYLKEKSDEFRKAKLLWEK